MQWAGSKKRPAQGAVARAVRAGEVDGKSLALDQFRKPMQTKPAQARPEAGHPGKVTIPDKLLWKMRNYVGGSWTSFLHTGLFHPGEDAGGPETDLEGRWTTVDEICPLCRAGRGDQRHVCMTCQHGELPALRICTTDRGGGH